MVCLFGALTVCQHFHRPPSLLRCNLPCHIAEIAIARRFRAPFAGSTLITSLSKALRLWYCHIICVSMPCRFILSCTSGVHGECFIDSYCYRHHLVYHPLYYRRVLVDDSARFLVPAVNAVELPRYFTLPIFFMQFNRFHCTPADLISPV